MLEEVNSIKDLEKLNIKEKKVLAEDIRKNIIDVVSENGGHLASNLGITELTIALNSVFDFTKDKIVWDVGHQTYVHKILTGRKNELKTLRKLGGIAGFPKVKESKYDHFDSGHSSNSISIALGMARARDIKNEKKNVIAVIGDGALTGGMALEALNDAGSSNTNLIVVLNDNEMSISKNIGGLNMFLAKLRTKKTYIKSNISGKKVISKIPIIGKNTVKIVRRIKRGFKQLIIPKMYFEDIGFRYLGLVDGHNISELENILEITKKVTGPVLIHVITKKGKGYEMAEGNPEKYHAVSPFNIEDGKPKKEKNKDYSKVFGDKLIRLAEKNNRIVAITASMKEGTGLSKFSEKFPDRFFDVGIAEQHAVGLAAGLAKEGIIPVVPIYSSFYQRAYDQVIHDIAIQELPVVLCVDRAGVVGNDGETHQGTLDMAFFRLVPNLIIMSPKDFVELEHMLEYAINLKKPVVIRYPRGEEEYCFNKCQNLKIGKAELIKEGKDLSLIGIGKTVSRLNKVAERLKKEGICAEVINTRFLKPLDKETIKNSILKTKNVIILEDGTEINGLGSAVKELILENKLDINELKCYSYPDEFIPHGNIDELERIFGVDEEHIYNYSISTLKKKELVNKNEKRRNSKKLQKRRR